MFINFDQLKNFYEHLKYNGLHGRPLKGGR